MRRIDARDHALGAALAGSYVFSLYRTCKNLGFSRDESFYFDAGGRYSAWFKLLFDGTKGATLPGTVDAYWGTNHEHPALAKSAFALSYLFLHQKWKWIEQASQAFRLPGMLFAGLAVFVVYLFGARLFSRTSGAFGAIAFALIPRVFYHSHLACFDVPATAMWGLALYTYFDATQQRTLRSAILFGLVYGLFLETKHNAWLMPGVFLPHALWVYGRERGSWKRRVPWPLVTMGTLGPAVFVGMWPWLWHDTVPRIREYASFHLNHVYYNMEFLGKNYDRAPSPPAFAPVMIVATVPTIFLVLAAIGMAPWAMRVVSYLASQVRKLVGKAGSLEGAPRDGELLLFLGFVVPIAVFFLPKTPIFGATKHWMPAYVTLAVFAGRGFAGLAALLTRFAMATKNRSKNARAAKVALLGAVLLLGPVLVTSHSHPFGLSTYVPFVGGTRGGASLGLNRQFWGFTTQSLAPYLASHARPGESIYIHDTTMGAYATLQAEGRIRSDLAGNTWSISDADLAIYHHELHMLIAEVNMMTAYRTATPAYVLEHDGVPIITVYSRRPR